MASSCWPREARGHYFAIKSVLSRSKTVTREQKGITPFRLSRAGRLNPKVAQTAPGRSGRYGRAAKALSRLDRTPAELARTLFFGQGQLPVPSRNRPDPADGWAVDLHSARMPLDERGPRMQFLPVG